jgi:hypothetical protein
MILVGDSINDCRFEFIECNARWGGTSGPMTLLNRLPLTPEQTYAIQLIKVPEIWQLEFAELERKIKDQLYNPLTGQGDLVLFNPARIEEQSAVDIIAIAESKEKAEQRLKQACQTFKTIATDHATEGSVTGFLIGHADFENAECDR